MTEAETGVWTCGHCGHSGPAHSMQGHPSFQCLFEPVWKPVAAPIPDAAPKEPEVTTEQIRRQVVYAAPGFKNLMIVLFGMPHSPKRQR